MNKDFKEAICNICGLTTSMDLDSKGEYKENTGLVKATIVGHYPSTPGNGYGALDDMTQYEFTLCEFCLDFIFSHSKIPPRVCNIGFKPSPYICNGSPDDIEDRAQEPFRPAETRVRQDEWRTGKQEFFERKLERDLARNITVKPKN